MGGISELIVVLLMAAKANKPVCLHAGGVGLCEMGQHLSIFDYIAISASHDDRYLEYAGALHEHFKTPVKIKNGHYVAPVAPGLSADMLDETVIKYEWPNGPFWNHDEETL